jgi:hypothetical protein
VSPQEKREIHEARTRERLTKLNSELGSPKTEREIADHARKTAERTFERTDPK